MGDSRLMVSNAAVAVAAGYALSVSPTKFASVGYGLFLAKGIAGVLCGILGKSASGEEGEAAGNDLFSTVYNHVNYISHSISVPLIAIDICSQYGIDEKIAMCNLIFPSIQIIMHFMDKSLDNDIIKMGKLTPLVMSAYASFIAPHQQYGYAFCVADLIGEFGNEFDTKGIVDFCYALCCVFSAFCKMGKSILD